MLRRCSRWLVAMVIGSSIPLAAARCQSTEAATSPSHLPESEQVGASAESAVTNAHYLFTVDPALAEKLQGIAKALAEGRSGTEIVQCRLQQVELLSVMANQAKPEQREPIMREIADDLCDAVAHDRSNYPRLVAFENQVAQAMPGSDVAAYVSFRVIQAGDGIEQAGCLHDRLAAYVDRYPLASDTSNALLQLAVSCELTGKNDEAKARYGQLVANFPNTAMALRAQGALRRLDLEGKVLKLALPLLFTEDERKDIPFDIDELRGKTVIVYFWSSSMETCLTEFTRLSELVSHHPNASILAVNLDNSQQDARTKLREMRVPATHVFQRGGLEGPVARRYGIISLPHIMLVAPNGVVLRQTVEFSSLETALESVNGQTNLVRE